MRSPKMKSITLSNKNYTVLLFVIGLILSFSFFSNKLMPGHDIVFHISRIISISDSLKEGIFPVRMYVDNVQFWGNPTGIFYPSFFLYIPSLLHLMGLPIEICYNFLIILIVFLALFSSWQGFILLIKSRCAGFFSTILYVSSGYYLANAFIRSALGELLALSFMPLAIACVIEITTKVKTTVRVYILGILAVSAIIESHVLSSVFLLLLIFVLLLVTFIQKKCVLYFLKRTFKFLCIIFFLNASFIIPFLLYFIKIPVRIAEPFKYFAFSSLSGGELLSFLVFWNFWLFTSLYCLISYQIHKHSINNISMQNYSFKTLNFCLALGLFFFLFSSSYPWHFFPNLIKYFQIIQFPWRTLALSTLLLSICGGIGIELLIKQKKIPKIKIIALSLLICVTHTIAIQYLSPNPGWVVKPKITWSRTPELSDFDYLYRDTDFYELIQLQNHYISNATIENFKKNLTYVQFSYRSDSDTEITIPLTNYPDYISIDQYGQKVPIKEDKNHLIVIPLIKGSGSITLHYVGMPIFKLADLLSLISVLFFCSYVIRVHQRNLWKQIS